MRNITLGALVFVLIYNILFFQTDNGIGTGLLFLLLNSFYLIIKKSDHKNLKLAISCSILSIIFGFLIGFRASEIIRNINLFVAIFFSASSLYFYKSTLNFSFDIPAFLLSPLRIRN